MPSLYYSEPQIRLEKLQLIHYQITQAPVIFVRSGQLGKKVQLSPIPVRKQVSMAVDARLC